MTIKEPISEHTVHVNLLEHGSFWTRSTEACLSLIVLISSWQNVTSTGLEWVCSKSRYPTYALKPDKKMQTCTAILIVNIMTVTAFTIKAAEVQNIHAILLSVSIHCFEAGFKWRQLHSFLKSVQTVPYTVCEEYNLEFISMGYQMVTSEIRKQFHAGFVQTFIISRSFRWKKLLEFWDVL